jgi:hypothetical protein
MKKIYIMALILLIMPTGICFNLGSYAKSNSQIENNGTSVFEVLLWTQDNRSMDIIFDAVQKPPGWNVTIDPKNITIDRFSGSEIISLPNGALNASVVKFNINGEDCDFGNRTIKISAMARISDNSYSQERFFEFAVFGDSSKKCPSGHDACALCFFTEIFILGIAIILLIICLRIEMKK